MTFPYPPEPAATVANPFVKVSDLLAALFTLADTETGITSAQRKAGAVLQVNAAKNAFVYSDFDAALVGSALVGSTTLVR